MTRLYLDIETIGTTDPDVIAEITATIAPPRSITRQETIAKWEAEEKPAAVLEAVSRTAFDGGYGRVICIGWAVDDGQVRTLCGPEKQLLADFLYATQTIHDAQPIGHNVAWDVRFLWQRAIVNHVQPTRWLRQAVKAKPWQIDDTMMLWNPERDRKVSLDRLCRILGVPTPKRDLDGSKVWQAFNEGRIDDIAAYCRADVEAVRACHSRMA